MNNINLLNHFEEPKNFGNLEHYNYTKMLGSPQEGAIIKIQLLIENNMIQSVGYKAYGATAIASMSWYTENIKDKSLEELKKIDIQRLSIDFEISSLKLNNILLIDQIHKDLIDKFEIKGKINARKKRRSL